MENGRGPIRTVVIDDHPVFRAGVARALGDFPEIKVVLEAGDGREGLDALRRHRPDVALVDMRMPVLSGEAVLRAAAEERLPTRIVMVSAYTDSGLAHTALSLGAAGYLVKDAAAEELGRAVQSAARGEVSVSPQLQPELLARIGSAHRTPKVTRSGRETEILALVADGHSGREIACRLFLSPATVKTYLQRIYEKLEVPNGTAAVAEALRRGLLT